MKHYGDIKNLSGYDLPVVDVITGGSPCQDLSVAGTRAGLDGERSSLFLEQVRIVKEMREHDRSTGRTDEFIRPRYMVWENVEGSFTSGKPKGADFQRVLSEIVSVVREDAPDVPLPDGGRWSKSGSIMGYGTDGCPFSIAWRLHDAQFWGVPQRRKRIALVADFGGVSAPEILFERKGLHGHPDKGSEKREGVAGTTGEGAEESSYTLKIRGGVDIDSYGKRAGKGPLVQHELSGTLGVSQDQTLFANCMNPPAAYSIGAFNSEGMKSENPDSGIHVADTARTLDATGGNPACYQGGTIVLEGNGYRDSHRGDGYAESETMYTLNTVEQHAVYDARGNGGGWSSPDNNRRPSESDN